MVEYESKYNYFLLLQRHFFIYGFTDVGLACFRRSSEMGHKDATFVLGMILLSQGDENVEEVIVLLNSMYANRGRQWDASACILKVKRFLFQPPTINPFSVRNSLTYCQNLGQAGMRRLCVYNDNEIEKCEYCRWCWYYHVFAISLRNG